MSEGQIRIGIGGWTYPPWRGSFYPDKLPQAKELEYASSQLGAIEINATFYSRQSPKSWEKWGNTAPDGFQFAVKGSRYCVMKSKLAEAGEGLSASSPRALQRSARSSARSCGNSRITGRFDRDDIAGFIDLLPAELDGISLRHAIEPRHESFRDDRFFDLCKARNIAIVFEDSDDYPCIEADTADFTYARLQRMSEDVPTGYDATSLDGFAARAREWRKRGDTYIFMINGAKVRAPAAALALQERLAG